MSLPLRLVAVACLAVVLAACQSAQKSGTNPPMPEPQQPAPRAPEVSPQERAKLHTELAAGYYERGKMNVALDELGEAAKLDPGSANVYNIYGLVYTVLGENAKAEQNFQRALQIAPQDSEIRQNWGWYLCMNGRAQASIPEFEQAIRNPLYRTPEVAMINAARCSASFGDNAAAETYYKRALAASPNNPSASYGLAFIAYKNARYPEARSWLRAAVMQGSPTPEALYLGVCVERKLGDTQGEMSFASQLRNRYPDASETKALPTGVCE